MTGHKTRIERDFWFKDGKLIVKRPARMSVSKRIAQRKSKKVRVAKKAP